MNNQRQPILQQSLRISFLYTIFAATWIIFCELPLAIVIQNQNQINVINNYQNILLALTTIILLYCVYKREYIFYQQEASLPLVKRQLASILDVSIKAIVSVDEKQRITLFSKGAEKIFGYNVQEVLNQPLDFLLPTDFINANFPDSSDITTNHQNLNINDCYEVILKNRNGKEFLAEISINKFSQNNQNFIYTMILRDITERKQIEQALKESENKFKILTETIACGIFVYSGTKFIYVNSAAEKISGYQREELLSMNLWDFVHPDHQKMVKESAIARQKSEEVPIRYEFKIIKKNGEERWIDYSATPGIITLNGQPCALGSAYDITERKWAESALQKGKEELEIRVENRTADLRIVNQKLLIEIAERQRAEEDLERQNLRARLFSDIALKIRQSLKLTKILEITVTEVRKMLQADRVLLFHILPDGSGKVVTEAVIPDLPILLGQTFSSEVFPKDYHNLYRDGKIQNINNVQTANIAPCHSEFLQQIGVTAKLVVPILKRGNLWGLMIAHQCQITRKWSDFEIELLQQLANQVGIALDQAQFLETVQESEKKFRQLTENINEVFWITSTDRQEIIYISPAYEKIWNRSCESLYENPQSWIDSIYWEDRDRVITALQNPDYTQNQELFNDEYRILKPDGSLRWIWLREFPIQNESKQVYRIAGIAEDITQRKQVEAEIFRTLEKEKELYELKSRFISMASHEFRTPLATILASSDLLKQFGDKLSPEKKQERLNKIQIEVKNMTDLLNDVLIIGKAAAGRMEFNPQPLNLATFFREIIEEIEITNGSTHKFNFSANNFQKTVSMDEKLLRQIVNNLLSNAVKYSPKNSTIYFELFCQSDQIIFKVRDEGIGIPPAEQKCLFEEFHRASNVGNISGTGLGMVIIKNAVDLHGGTLSVDSKLGVGTTFTVSIPIS